MARALVKTLDGSVVGEIKSYTGSTLPTNFLFCDGKTIGNAGSGATSRANSDTQSLFVHLWDNFANTEAPVSGGRGASALADFNANKTIQLPDLRGRTTAGKDNMGGTAANRLTSGGSGITGNVLGATGGAETHTLSVAQLPSHSHDMTHTHQHYFGNTPAGGVLNAGGGAGVDQRAVTNTLSQSTNNTGNQGANNAHQNTQPTFILNKIIRY